VQVQGLLEMFCASCYAETFRALAALQPLILNDIHLSTHHVNILRCIQTEQRQKRKVTSNLLMCGVQVQGLLELICALPYAKTFHDISFLRYIQTQTK
jgi:hypothetical protein